MFQKTKICIVGLGYVGLPLTVAFSKAGFPVFGFDKNPKRILKLKKYLDTTGEITPPKLRKVKIFYSTNPQILQEANFIIVAIPTPVDSAKNPDLTLLREASRTVGENLKKGSIVVFESTVYPGVTEEICAPIIEKYSRLEYGSDWHLGYSPERVNPGDKKHTIDKVVKIVSGQDQKTLKKISEIYGRICKAGVHKAPDIKTAEAAKVIENIQRDLNIALINELALIFHRLGLNTQEVLAAAATKWNFHQYEPGLIGGHCIPVDPYYLTYCAEKLGYHPEVILAGRRINDYMPLYVADLVIQGLAAGGKRLSKAKVLIMGLTFKENVKDTRNSKAREVIQKLKQYGVNLYGYDPLLTPEEMDSFPVKRVVSLQKTPKMDGIILSFVHNGFKKITLSQLKKITGENPVLIDVKSHFLAKNPAKEGFIYKCL